MENETKNSRERLEIQGRYNLAMGAQLVREDFEREIDEAAKDESIPPMTPEQMENFFSVVHEGQARIRAQKRRKAFLKRFSRFAAVAAALIMLVPAVAMNVSASRTAISNFVIQNFGDYSAIRYDVENNAQPPFGWRSEYYPKWLPEEYHVSSVRFDSQGDYVWYINDADKQISFSVLDFAECPLLNSENRKEQEVIINGRRAFLYISDDMREVALVLYVSGAVLRIEGTLTVGQIMQIAESIEI